MGWNVAYCYTKESAGNPDDEAAPAAATTKPPTTPAPKPSAPAPTGNDLKYKTLARGKCTNADATELKHKYFSRGSYKLLERKCNADPKCYGYSASRWGGGLLWMEG